MIVDSDRDIEGSWDQFVPQSAGTYYDSVPGRRLPEGIELSRVRLPDDEEDSAVDHIIEGIFIKHSVSPYASLDGQFAAELERERNRLLSVITQPDGEDFLEFNRDQYENFLEMQPVLNGFSVNTTQKIDQASNNSTIVASRFIDRVSAEAHGEAVHQRINSIRVGTTREAGRLSFRQKNHLYPTFGSATLDERIDFADLGLDGRSANDKSGAWIQALYNNGRINSESQRHIGYSGYGVLAGFDAWVGEDILVGIFGGYTSAEFSHGISVSDTRISRGSKLKYRTAGVYGGYQYDSFWLNGELRHVRSKVQGNRMTDILLSGPTVARSEFTGKHWYGSVEAGYLFNLDEYLDERDSSHLRIEPTLSLQIAKQSYSKFDEIGAGMLNATVAPGKSEIAAVSLGSKLTYSKIMGNYEVISSISARWKKEIQRKGSNEKLGYSFLTDGDISTKDALQNIGDSIAVLGLNVEAKPLRNSGPSVALSYNKKFLNGFDDYSLSAYLHWKF